MSSRSTHGASEQPGHRAVVFKGGLVVLLLALAAISWPLGQTPIYAGDNVWTWAGVFGNAETMLSNPLNPTTAYAVVNTSHLFKTINGGQTWSELPAPPHAADGAPLNVYEAYTDSNVLYSWGYDSGEFAYRSTDGGNTWQALSMGGVLVVSPADWQEVYLATATSLFKSTDAGDTWTKIADFPTACPEPYSLYIAPSAPQVMVTIVSPPGSMDFALCKTLDGGQTWSPLSVTSPSIHSVVFDPKNSNTLYVAAVGGGLKSSDGGSSWQPLSGTLTNPAQFIIDPDNTRVIHAVDWNQNGGVFESIDGGATWTLLNTGITGVSVRSIAIGSRNPLEIYAGVMSQGIWELTRTTVQGYSITVNDGALYTNQTPVTLTLTAPPGTNQMLISNDGGFGGATWEPFTNTKAWTIMSYGDYVIPRTVYAKFMTNSQMSGEYQDDIILDQTSPTGSVQITSTLAAGSFASLPALIRSTSNVTSTLYLPLVAKNYTPGSRTVGLALSASDNLSGVDGMLVSNSSTFSSAQWQPYAKALDWNVNEHGSTTVYVIYRDRAGNDSPVYAAMTAAP